MRRGRCSTTVHRSSRCWRRAVRASRASLSGPVRARRRWSASSPSRRACRTMASCRRGASSLVGRRPARRIGAAAEPRAFRGGPERDGRPPCSRSEEFARYAGQLVVLISAPVENHKIPVWEQQLSCGTVGMNLLTAAHALGFVAGWVTGWRAYSPTRATPPSARPASGSPDSSSSVMPGASWKTVRDPRSILLSARGNRRSFDFPIEFDASRCIMTA